MKKEQLGPEEQGNKDILEDPLKDILYFRVSKDSLPAIHKALNFVVNDAEKYIVESTINSVLEPIYHPSARDDGSDDKAPKGEK